jgi:hypothetical protein
MHLDFLAFMTGIEEYLGAEAYMAPHAIQRVQGAKRGGFTRQRDNIGDYGQRGDGDKLS